MKELAKINEVNILIFMMLFSIAVPACTSKIEPMSVTVPDPNPIIVDAEITPTIDIFEPLEISDIAFPRQKPVEGPREVMEAELVGDLVESGGCVRVKSLYNDGSYLPIWPPDFTLGFENEIPVILDVEGNIVGRVGEEIYMGGGEGSENALPDSVRDQLPADCGGPFWIVGDGVRPNIRHDSGLIQLDVITTTERTAILLHKKPILDEWVEEPSVISGILRWYNPQRCPRIQTESGITDYLPIWPPEYSLQMTDGLVEILNGSGEIVAQEGTEVVLRGSAIPHSWDSEHYRQLYYNIPGDCHGPYWIVDK